MTETLIVVSYYDRRPTQPLIDLLHALETLDAGASFDLLIVVNSTSERDLLSEIKSATAPNVEFLTRPNCGMNIGAWDAGWRYRDTYKHYLFLQDECIPVRSNWLRPFINLLEMQGVGLVGESINEAWDRPWNELRLAHTGSDMPGHLVAGRKASRIDAYDAAFEMWDIPKASTGRHLRSLVWALSGETMQKIGGFPQGANYGECIAAEISVSMLVANEGLSVHQIADDPFFWIGHREWNSDYGNVSPSHKRTGRPRRSLSRIELDEETAKALSAFPENSAPISDLDAGIKLAVLQLKLDLREREILRLRNALKATNNVREIN